jgi:hypothetical protein
LTRPEPQPAALQAGRQAAQLVEPQLVGVVGVVVVLLREVGLEVGPEQERAKV